MLAWICEQCGLHEQLTRSPAAAEDLVVEAGLAERAFYVERGTMPEEVVMPLLEKVDDKAPYFSMILVPGQGRRP